MSDKRVTARFRPQAWVNDYPIEVDPLGEDSWDVTEEILAMGKDKSLELRDDQYSTDALRESDGAPEWVKDWTGPFFVEVEESVRDFWLGGEA